MNVSQEIPLPSVSIIDAASGQVNAEWYRFLLTILLRTGQERGIDVSDVLRLAMIGDGSAVPPLGLGSLLHISEIPRAAGDTITPLLGEPQAVGGDALIPALLSEGAPPPGVSDALLAALFVDRAQAITAAPVIAVTLGASPATYRAPVDGNLLMTGGTVSAITVSRDGTTFLASGMTAGFIPMSRGDQAQVTYTVAPTGQNFIPR